MMLLIFLFGEHKTASLLLLAFCAVPDFCWRRCKSYCSRMPGAEMLGAAGGRDSLQPRRRDQCILRRMMITSGFGWNAIALPAALLSFLA